MSQYGIQNRRGQHEPATGRKAMTVIGPVKRNKMGLYKTDASNDSSEDAYYHISEKEQHGGMYSATGDVGQHHVGMTHNAGGGVPRGAASDNLGQPPMSPNMRSGMGMFNNPPQSPSRMGMHNSFGNPMGQGLGSRMPASRPAHPGDVTPGRPGFTGLPSSAASSLLHSPQQPPRSTPFNTGGGLRPHFPGGPVTGNGAPGQPDIDSSAFPALNGGHASAAAAGFPPGGYAGVSSGKKLKPRNEEFSILQDEFPALPGAKASNSKTPPNSPHIPQQQPRTMISPGPGLLGHRPDSGEESAEQYGLLGLLNVIRMTEQDVNTLALGTDLTTLGLNLNYSDLLHPGFASPWADGPLRSHEPNFQLPSCYNMKTIVLPMQTRLQQFTEETLFLIFYSMPCDVMQQAAACMLFSRDWRYHKDQKIWITRAPGMEPTQKTPNYERGTYIYFDVNQWKKVTKEFVLHYQLLEERKPMPT